MGFLTWIIFGGLVGWIAGKIVTDGGNGVFVNVIVGVVGAAIGGWVMSLINESPVTGFNLYSLLVAILGACILLYVVKLLSK